MAKNRGAGGTKAPAATNQSETAEPVLAPEEVKQEQPVETVEEPVEPTEVVEPVEPVEPTETVVKPEGLPELIEQCRKAYPSNRTFYLTSDNQVFLANARNLALLHQRSLKDGEVQTFEV